MVELKQKQIDEIARYWEEQQRNPTYRLYIAVVNETINEMMIAAIYREEDNTFDRGKIVGMKEMANKPDDYIKQSRTNEQSE